MEKEVTYKDLNLKKPIEQTDYCECSSYVVDSVEEIIKNSIANGKNQIIINTNLRRGLPMENINKVAGPFVESWAQEQFEDVLEDKENKYKLINVENCERLNMADIILQFKRERKNSSAVTGNIDVKATSEDIANSGKSPNITSFGRIRSAYVDDPDYIFIILSLKHKVYCKKNDKTKLMDGIMEVVGHRTYDLKHLSASDISYNPALGTGQLQVRDIHYVDIEVRTAWEFCQLLDQKFIASKKGFEGWLPLAKAKGWIKDE